jgi:hypothetical protein
MQNASSIRETYPPEIIERIESLSASDEPHNARQTRMLAIVTNPVVMQEIAPIFSKMQPNTKMRVDNFGDFWAFIEEAASLAERKCPNSRLKWRKPRYIQKHIYGDDIQIELLRRMEKLYEVHNLYNQTRNKFGKKTGVLTNRDSLDWRELSKDEIERWREIKLRRLALTRLGDDKPELVRAIFNILFPSNSLRSTYERQI